MKKIIYLLILFAGTSCTQAKTGNNTSASAADSNKTTQENPEKPKVDTNYIGKAAETNPAITYIPAFEITTVSGAKFTQANLKKKQALNGDVFFA